MVSAVMSVSVSMGRAQVCIAFGNSEACEEQRLAFNAPSRWLGLACPVQHVGLGRGSARCVAARGAHTAGQQHSGKDCKVTAHEPTRTGLGAAAAVEPASAAQHSAGDQRTPELATTSGTHRTTTMQYGAKAPSVWWPPLRGPTLTAPHACAVHVPPQPVRLMPYALPYKQAHAGRGRAAHAAAQPLGRDPGG